MNEVLIFTILTLCALGVLAAVILYFVAQKFYVYEDPRIDEVEALLPGANCGGCGFPGCRGLADALVSRDDISALNCPVGGSEIMKAAASHLGKAAADKEAQIAVLRCNGSCANRPRTNLFDGAQSCAVMAQLYAGETGCSYGCFGKGDCTVVCNFDAIHINPQTGLPEVDEEKCTACGACVKACPKLLIELRKKGPKGRRVFVSCRNKDKGGIARKACKAACIGCGKCVKICPFDAITLESNLAYIDPNKCRLCRKCVPECPTGAILETNFPVRPPKPAGEAKPAPKPAAQAKTETAPADAVEPKAVAEDISVVETAQPVVAAGVKQPVSTSAEVAADTPVPDCTVAENAEPVSADAVVEAKEKTDEVANQV